MWYTAGMKNETCEYATLCTYESGDYIRMATVSELARSIVAARGDGGHGVITVNGKSCYVVGEDEEDLRKAQDWLDPDTEEAAKNLVQ